MAVGVLDGRLVAALVAVGVTVGGQVREMLVSAREPSVNFDMQSLASLLIGDRITVRRSDHRVRFLHPRGWNYYATLRRKLHWNEGALPGDGGQ